MFILDEYRRAIREIIQEYAQFNPAVGDVQIEVIFDEPNDVPPPGGSSCAGG
jgi:hypothetical protein